MSNINYYKYIYMYKCMYKSVKCVYNTKNHNLSTNHLLFLLITRFNNNLVIILKYTHLNIIMCKLRSIKKVPLYILNCELMSHEENLYLFHTTKLYYNVITYI